MKKFIIISCFFALFINSMAQQVKKLELYLSEIDQMLEDCATGEKFLSENYPLSLENVAKFSNSEKLEYIAKIEDLFLQEKCMQLYREGNKLLNALFFYERHNSSSLVVRQKLVEVFLKYYFYPYMQEGRIIYATKDDFTQKAQKRLIEVLDEKKTEKEYELYVKDAREIITPTDRGWREAAKIMKESGRVGDDVLMQIRDSIIENRDIPIKAKGGFDLAQMNIYLLYRIGDLNLKKAVPVLQKNLSVRQENDSWRSDEEYSYRITLVRLGDKEQYNYMVNNMLDIDVFNVWHFPYFHDDAVIWKYIELNYNSDRMIDTGLSGVRYPADFMTIHNIAPYIKNLPENLQFPTKDLSRDNQIAWGKKVYKWIMDNKDTVEFDYDKEKKWFWRWG